MGGKYWVQVVFMRVLWYQWGVVCARAYVWYVCLQPLALAVAQFNLMTFWAGRQSAV